MKFRVISGFVNEAGNAVYPGEVIELGDKERGLARHYIDIGRIVEADDKDGKSADGKIAAK